MQTQSLMRHLFGPAVLLSIPRKVSASLLLEVVVLLTGLFCQWLVPQAARRTFLDIQKRETYSGNCEHRA